MAHCIIRSVLNFDSILFKKSDVIKSGRYYYYHFEFSGNSFTSEINYLDTFMNKIVEESKKSDLIKVWEEKEKMYDLSLVPDKGFYFSEEYHNLKSKITEDAFKAIILRESSEVFEVFADIKGTYEDYKNTGVMDIMFITRYKDSIYNTSYKGKDFTSSQGYVSSRDEFVIWLIFIIYF